MSGLRDVILDLAIPEDVELIDDYVVAGYGAPKITDDMKLSLSVLGPSPKDLDTVRYEIVYVLEQFAKMFEAGHTSQPPPCTLSVKLDKHTIASLKRAQKGDIELAGELVVKAGPKSVFTLSMGALNLREGSIESVKIRKSRYNFHTHPHSGYIKNNVKYAWPSGKDYVGFLKAVYKYGTVLHIVSTREGVYFLSVTPSWVGRLCEITPKSTELRKFVSKRYGARWIDKSWTPAQYVKAVNGFSGPERAPFHGMGDPNGSKLDKAIFNVQFLEWKSACKVIKIVYPRDGVNCFTGSYKI